MPDSIAGATRANLSGIVGLNFIAAVMTWAAEDARQKIFLTERNYPWWHASHWTTTGGMNCPFPPTLPVAQNEHIAITVPRFTARTTLLSASPGTRRCLPARPPPSHS